MSTQSSDDTLVLSSRGMSSRVALATVDAELTKRKAQLVAIAGEPKVAERLLTLSMHALANPRLATMLRTADLATVFLAVREAAAMDLVPNGIAGDGWLVPYWNAEKGLYDIQFQAGWKGLQKLLAGTAEIASGVAYAGDRVFEYEQGSREYVRHIIALSDRGERVAAWADATLLASGNHRIAVMPIADVEMRRRSSKMADRGAWVDWYDPMARKTVTRDLCNHIPRLPERLQRLLTYEDAAEERAVVPPSAPQLSAPQGLSAADRARQLLGVSVDGSNGDSDTPPEAPADLEPDARPATQESAPGSAEPSPAAIEADGSTSGTDCPVDGCVREAGHAGNHRNAEKETWT